MAKIAVANPQRRIMETLILQQLHWEALTPETQQAFHLVEKLAFSKRFYLAGDTGLALHLGHRFSVDLDLFCEQPDAVNPAERAMLREALNDPTLSITFDKDSTSVGRHT